MGGAGAGGAPFGRGRIPHGAPHRPVGPGIDRGGGSGDASSMRIDAPFRAAPLVPGPTPTTTRPRGFAPLSAAAVRPTILFGPQKGPSSSGSTRHRWPGSLAARPWCRHSRPRGLPIRKTARRALGPSIRTDRHARPRHRNRRRPACHRNAARRRLRIRPPVQALPTPTAPAWRRSPNWPGWVRESRRAGAPGRIVGSIRYWPVLAGGHAGAPARPAGGGSDTPGHRHRGGPWSITRSTWRPGAAGRSCCWSAIRPNYRRFGFRPAAPHGLTMPGEQPHRLMVRELSTGALEGVAGEVVRWGGGTTAPPHRCTRLHAGGEPPRARRHRSERRIRCSAPVPAGPSAPVPLPALQRPKAAGLLGLVGRTCGPGRRSARRPPRPGRRPCSASRIRPRSAIAASVISARAGVPLRTKRLSTWVAQTTGTDAASHSQKQFPPGSRPGAASRVRPPGRLGRS